MKPTKLELNALGKIVPKDWPVQPIEDVAAYRLRAWPEKPDLCICGSCERWWDNSIVTSMTPTPGARCPFEAFH